MNPLILTMLAQQGRYMKVRKNDGWKCGFSESYGHSASKEFPSLEEAVHHEVSLLNSEASRKRMVASDLSHQASNLDVLAEQILSLLGTGD